MSSHGGLLETSVAGKAVKVVHENGNFPGHYNQRAKQFNLQCVTQSNTVIRLLNSDDEV